MPSGRFRDTPKLISPDHLIEIDPEVAGFVRLYCGVLQTAVDTSLGSGRGDYWWEVMDARDFLRFEAEGMLRILAQWAPGLGNIRMSRRLEHLEELWVERDAQHPADHPLRLYDKRGEGTLPVELIECEMKRTGKKDMKAETLQSLIKRRGLHD